MPLFHWPAMPWRSYGVRENEQIRSKIAKMVWWNISCLLFCMCCVSTAYRWCMSDAYATNMLYEWWCHLWCRIWEIDHCVFTAQVAYAQLGCTCGDQRDSIVYGGRMYSAWAAYAPNLWIHLIICELWMWHLNVHVVECIHMYPNVHFHCLIWYRMCRNDVVLVTGIMIC